MQLTINVNGKQQVAQGNSILTSTLGRACGQIFLEGKKHTRGRQVRRIEWRMSIPCSSVRSPSRCLSRNLREWHIVRIP